MEKQVQSDRTLFILNKCLHSVATCQKTEDFLGHNAANIRVRGRHGGYITESSYAKEFVEIRVLKCFVASHEAVTTSCVFRDKRKI